LIELRNSVERATSVLLVLRSGSLIHTPASGEERVSRDRARETSNLRKRCACHASAGVFGVPANAAEQNRRFVLAVARRLSVACLRGGPVDGSLIGVKEACRT
jgi:hypothetical protein